VNIVILKWQKPLWEGDQEVAKMSSRDEPMWVAIHMCMEAMLGISLYISPYLKLEKNAMSSLSLMFSLQQNWRIRRWNRFCLDAGACAYIHVSKCKNGKINNKMKVK
jgi:hypothetical protein